MPSVEIRAITSRAKRAFKGRTPLTHSAKCLRSGEHRGTCDEANGSAAGAEIQVPTSVIGSYGVRGSDCGGSDHANQQRSIRLPGATVRIWSYHDVEAKPSLSMHYIGGKMWHETEQEVTYRPAPGLSRARPGQRSAPLFIDPCEATSFPDRTRSSRHSTMRVPSPRFSPTSDVHDNASRRFSAFRCMLRHLRQVQRGVRRRGRFEHVGRRAMRAGWM